MNPFVYPAQVAKQADGYAVSFRDVPEALTSGATKKEALDMAADALATAMQFYFEDRRAVPLPSKARKGEEPIELPASVSTCTTRPRSTPWPRRSRRWARRCSFASPSGRLTGPGNDCPESNSGRRSPAADALIRNEILSRSRLARRVLFGFAWTSNAKT